MPFSFVPITIAALAGVEATDAGLASGLINTSQQIGGALGIAVLSSIAVAQTNDGFAAGRRRPRSRSPTASRPRSGSAPLVAALGVVTAVVLVRRDELQAAPAVELRLVEGATAEEVALAA